MLRNYRPMLDLHCHILPGVDDGPSTMDQSIEMAIAAFRDGTRTIVAAPHSRDVNERSTIACVRALAAQLNEELRARSIPLDVVLGMENHLALDTPEQVDAGAALPVQGTRCILIELPFELYPYHTRDTLSQPTLPRSCCPWSCTRSATAPFNKTRSCSPISCRTGRSRR